MDIVELKIATGGRTEQDAARSCLRSVCILNRQQAARRGYRFLTARLPVPYCPGLLPRGDGRARQAGSNASALNSPALSTPASCTVSWAGPPAPTFMAAEKCHLTHEGQQMILKKWGELSNTASTRGKTSSDKAAVPLHSLVKFTIQLVLRRAPSSFRIDSTFCGGDIWVKSCV